MVFAADYPFLEIFWTMLIFFCWVIWIWMVITVFMDVFRRDDISGWGKAAWSLFVIVLPFLGVFVYLISQGRGMAERKVTDVRASRAAYDDHIRHVAASGGPTDQIARGKELLDSGAIDQAEFEQLKRKALAQPADDDRRILAVLAQVQPEPSTQPHRQTWLRATAEPLAARMQSSGWEASHPTGPTG